MSKTNTEIIIHNVISNNGTICAFIYFISMLFSNSNVYVFFFRLFLSLSYNRYNKNSSSSCNTPRKAMGNAAVERATSVKHSTFSANNSMQLKPTDASNVDDGGSKNVSRDLFTIASESANESANRSILFKASQKMCDQSPQTNDGHELVRSPLYSDFTGDLKTTLTPIAVHRLGSPGTYAFSTPAKNISFVSTPSFKQSATPNYYHGNRSGNNRNTSHNSRQQSHNDSRSFDDSGSSSTCFDTSSGTRQSHEKSKDRRSANTSSICLGDFLTPLTSKQNSHRARKSLNSTERSPTTTTINTSHEKDFPNFTPKRKVNRITLTPTSTAASGAAAAATPTTSQQSHGLIATPKSNQPIKPTKRVVPTRIGASSNEFNCPAFRSDNNILELPHEENAVSTRDLLKSQKDMIRRVFQEEQPPETNLRTMLHESLNPGKKSATTKNTPPIDLNKITNKPMLDKFIDIYSIVLDLNLVTNVLTEVAYLLNLINLDVDEYYERNPHMLDGNSINDRTNAIDSTTGQINAVAGDSTTKQCTVDTLAEQSLQQEANRIATAATTTANTDVTLNKVSTCATADNIDAAILLLKNINNCIYFGLGVLQLQKNILRMLDVTSIKVLLENERLTTLDSTIKDDLMNVYSHKMQLERLLRTHDTTQYGGFAGSGAAALLAPNSSMKVFYQQEQDTQMNFPSTRESAAFKKQRDHFYSILG